MFTPLFQVVAYFCKPTPLGLLCIADALSLEEYVLKVSSSPGNSCPSPAVVCKSWHYENVVVGPGFVVFLWLLGKWLKVAERPKCKLVCGQECWTRQVNVVFEYVITDAELVN